MSDAEHQAMLAKRGFRSIKIYRDELFAFRRAVRNLLQPRQAGDLIDGGCR
jgi:hypothetical protein